MAEIRVEAELAGAVWKIEAAPVDQMAEGDAILILESMKMEIPVECPRSARLVELRVAEGDVVREGQILAILTDS